ncbi:DUF1214 domain-containing protein [Nocardia arizonensis]|uniref:DUF1214 domain-containing protein n=1 Tax=Nocardia arizonensis TaxID=1141647 RepID=UPI0006D05E78|nr:DUF1214 domain-containing protein [Nocardia arizonensis]
MTTGISTDTRYPFHDGYPTPEAARRARADTDFQRAVLAYRFWYPTVSMEGIFHGNRAAGMPDNASMGIAATGPRHVGFTLNSDTPYGAAVLDLSGGPMVIGLPKGPYLGLVDDHHQRWVTDLGIPGPDGGSGGTYVIVPPEYDGELPADAHLARSGSHKVLLALRALPIGGLDNGLAALRRVRIHPLGALGTALDFVDATRSEMDWSCLDWEDGLEFWRVLHTVLESEPVVEEFAPMYGLLTDLGIGRGTPFAPEDRLAALLTDAARTGRDAMLVSAFASARPDRLAWPDRRWEWVGLVEDNGDFRTASGIDLEARDRWFAQAIIASPAMFGRRAGTGSLYWLGVRDAEGDYLDGGASYTVEIPQPVPAELFWSITIYDAATRSQVRTETGIAALRSQFELNGVPTHQPLRLHFGPAAPDHAHHRWLQTVPGRGWFAYLRVYGPRRAAFEGTWRPGDFRRTD